MQECCKKMQFLYHRFLTRFSQIIHFMQDPSRQDLFGRIFSGNTFIARYLHESCKISIIAECCKFLLFARMLQDFYYLQESCKISIICNNVARNLLVARILQDFYYLHKFARICKNNAFSCKILQESCKISQESCNNCIFPQLRSFEKETSKVFVQSLLWSLFLRTQK